MREEKGSGKRKRERNRKMRVAGEAAVEGEGGWWWRRLCTVVGSWTLGGGSWLDVGVDTERGFVGRGLEYGI